MHHGSHHHRAAEEAPSLDGLFRVLRRRLRFLVACRGAALTLATVITLVVTTGAVDCWMRIDPPWLRAVLLLSIIAAGAGSALKSVILPLLRRNDDVDMALEIERRRPEWRDALASSLEFSAGGCSPQRGAPALQRESVARTITRWKAAESDSIIDARPCFRAVGLALTSCLLAVTAVASDLDRAEVALLRLLSPYDCPDWPQRHNLILLDSGFERIKDPRQPLHFVAGMPATLYVEDLEAELPGDVMLSVAREHRSVQRIPLRQVTLSDPAGRQRTVCLAQLPPEPRYYAVRVTGGDDSQMPWYRIAFFPQPEIRDIEVVLRPPQYLGPPDETREVVRESIDAFVGTHVRLAGRANVPLQSAMFRRDGRPAQNLALSPDGLDFTVEFDVTDAERFSYWFDLTDRHGLKSNNPRRLELRGIEDAAPVVSIERPATDLTATPSAEIPLRIVARDDVRVTGARLMLSDPPGSAGERALPVTMQPSPSVELDTTLPLAGLRLPAGRQLTLRAEADDACDLGPRHVGNSSSRQLTIVTLEEKRQELLSRQTGLVQGLERASELQSRSLQQTRELRLQWQAAHSFQPADVDLLKRIAHDHTRIVAELNDDTRGAAPRARALLEEFHWNKIDDQAADHRLQHLSAEVDRLLAEVCPASEQSLDRARKLIESSTDEPGPAEIDAALDGAETAQLEAADTLDALLALFAEWQQQYDLTRLTNEIISTQEQINHDTAATGRRTLTRKLSDLSPQDQADLARLGDRQIQVAKTVQRFAENIEQLLADSARNGQGLSESDLRDALDVVRGRSVAEEMQRSGALIVENRIGETLSRQQEIRQSLSELEQILKGLGALDAEVLLKRVRDAEQEVETLRREQTDAMRQTQSFVNSGQSSNAPLVDELRQRQQALATQTAESARRLRRQQFHQPSAAASRAADAMQRAAAQLQGETVPTSTTAQQEAVDDLVQAQHALADLRRQLELSQSATRFVELAAMVQSLEARQQGLSEETVRLDVQRRERGSLSRSQLATLRQLADSQSQLADDVVQLEGSVPDAPVLEVALAAVEKDMQSAASRLVEREIDAPTQAAQDSALQRLHRLHDALVASQSAADSPNVPAAPRELEDEAVPDLTLLAQLRLIAQMQADLTGRTEPLIERARRGQELTPGQRMGLEQLAAEQARLTELLAGLLARPDAVPPSDTGDAPP